MPFKTVASPGRFQTETLPIIVQSNDRPSQRTVQISLSLPTQLPSATDERAKSLGISREALINQASVLFL